MKLKYDHLEEIIFGKTGFRRFTQDSAILPDVWMEFGEKPYDQADVLLTPTWGYAPGHLSVILKRRVRENIEEDNSRPRFSEKRPRKSAVAYNGSTIAVRLFFDQMIRVILPITSWWEKYIVKESGAMFRDIVYNEKFRNDLAKVLAEAEWDINKASKLWHEKEMAQALETKKATKKKGAATERPASIPKLPAHLIWLIKIVGVIAIAQSAPPPEDAAENSVRDEGWEPLKDVSAVLDAFAILMDGIEKVESKPDKTKKIVKGAGKDKETEDSNDEKGVIWAVNLNREAKAMIWKSTTAVKADASRRLFEVNCEDIRWAVIDSGIDATHPAFRERDRDGNLKPDVYASRVIKTFDFTRIRRILSGDPEEFEKLPKIKKLKDEDIQVMQERLTKGRALDWDLLAPMLEIPHEKDFYTPPVFEHGTHVAGIMAADWRKKDDADNSNLEGRDIMGVCPDMALYDLRVLDEFGVSDEFSVLAALQFAQYINTNSEYQKVHGVNLSLSIRHKVKNFACGCTPVCEEAERLVNAGLVVVAAAGNDGYLESHTGAGLSEGYRSISITDPGNAQGVITVGATHRDSPHTYGVSYFSSRGPTGDGRIKPDIVAPGEKIYSTVPDIGLKAMDGTSMAAPHVSGAAALLIGRYRELIGKPVRIKEILCETATDLGRERYFQGHGMLDILRAMQSV
jgi:hypothetical protein